MAVLLAGAPSLRLLRGVVRACVLAEARSAPSPSFFPRPATAVLVALSYLCFFGVVAYARRRGGPLATCGCFGRPDTPPTMLHLVLDLTLAAAATAVVLGGSEQRHAGDAAGAPALGGLPAPFRERGGLWLTALALSALAALTGARRLARPLPVQRRVSLSTALVACTARVLEGRLSRRSLINRSAFVGSAVAVGSGLDLALKPGTAYGAICECGNAGCGCGSTCCSGFSEFCCEVSGANYCPENTVMGGWWVADNSSYCGGPRYYMDCNATCSCESGCGGGFGFCEPAATASTAAVARWAATPSSPGASSSVTGSATRTSHASVGSWCRVVACVPPWTVDPSCTTAEAVDNSTAEQNEPCWTPAPPMPPTPPCASPATKCEVVGVVPSAVGGGYAVVTSFGRLFGYGDFPDDGDASRSGSWPPSWRPPPARRGATSWRQPTAASSTTEGPRSSAPWAGGPSTCRSSG